MAAEADSGGAGGHLERALDVGAHGDAKGKGVKGTEMTSATDAPGATPPASAVVDAGQISLPPSPPGSARVWPDDTCVA